jgi:hypothetical protein
MPWRQAWFRVDLLLSGAESLPVSASEEKRIRETLAGIVAQLDDGG